MVCAIGGQLFGCLITKFNSNGVAINDIKWVAGNEGLKARFKSLPSASLNFVKGMLIRLIFFRNDSFDVVTCQTLLISF